MHVTNLEARAIARETAWSKSREPALVRQFGQRIDLVHELRKLAAAKEIADDRGERLRVDQLLRGHRFDTLIEKRHALFAKPFGAGQTDAAFVGEQLAIRAQA